MSTKSKMRFDYKDTHKVVDAEEMVQNLNSVLKEWKKDDVKKKEIYIEKRKDLEKEYKLDTEKGYSEDYTTWITNRFLSLLENFERVNNHRYELIQEVENYKNYKGEMK